MSVLLQSDLTDGASDLQMGGGKQLEQLAAQFKQYSAVAHPITLDSAEINSVDKLLGKRTGKKKKGGNSARTPVRSDAVARESPTPRCGEERWPLLFVRLWLHR